MSLLAILSPLGVLLLILLLLVLVIFVGRRSIVLVGQFVATTSGIVIARRPRLSLVLTLSETLGRWPCVPCVLLVAFG